ncbi:hypothetical protein GGS20DRAFT_599259 [Poronia punctata]|nr:hypothetical protein GGS20DRAFT_599259 [Poronia punctata]
MADETPQSPYATSFRHNTDPDPFPTGCLSGDDHNITDLLAHYFGCIKFNDRAHFFTDMNPLWRQEIQHRQQTLPDPTGVDSVEKLRNRSESDVNRELERIGILRRTLSANENDKSLVQEVEYWRRAWWVSCERRPSVNNAPPRQNDVATRSQGERYCLEKDITAPVIQFDNFMGFTDSDRRIRGKFPHQKTTIEQLLCEMTSRPEDKLLHKDRHTKPGQFKYFHVPYNNMIWAESAIAQYYGDEMPDLEAMSRQFQRPRKTRTTTLLQERYWRGQLHGNSSSPAHARYMSPTCEVISSSLDRKDVVPNHNITLFMPYLHWDISRRREQLALEIEKIRDAEAENRDAKDGNSANREAQLRRRRTFGHFEDVVDAAGDNGKKMGQPLWRQQIKSPLGRYLFAVADLHEYMTTYRDRKLLRRFLPLNPPIHPRRTLDQSFYWTVKSTTRRDRDQVVYRGTTARAKDFHRYDKKNQCWPDHQGLGSGKKCRVCTQSIRKVSRVVMVDQLWMWILDEKTIITCFPKRYGANKQDYSGIHKAIRTRLESQGSCEIRTVFELAIIILDECTKTFFDQARSPDRQPQIIDEFSKAIGNIRLWDWTAQARKIYAFQGYVDTTDPHVALLDINPEGKLEREVEDILEELDMMLHIANIHQEIVKRFIEQVEHILDPEGLLSNTYKRRGKTESRSRPNPRTPTGNTNDNKKAEFQAFMLVANECQERVNCHVKDLERLRTSARNAADDVGEHLLRSAVVHLLNMKQQQASVIQAWQSVKQSEESIKEGRSIMILTLATIVFLPLSFLTSVFGMNNREFGNNTWTLREQFLLISVISVAVIFVSLLFAFSSWLRIVIWSMFTKCCMGILVRTGIYKASLLYGKGRRQIYSDTLEKIDSMSNGVKDQITREKVKKSNKEKTKEEGTARSIPAFPNALEVIDENDEYKQRRWVWQMSRERDSRESLAGSRVGNLGLV